MSNGAGAGTQILVGTIIGLLVAVIIALVTWFIANPVGLLGGVLKEEFAPFETCAKDEKIYAPGHHDADKNNCVKLDRYLRLGKDISPPEHLPASTFQQNFQLEKNAVVFVSAYVTSNRDGKAPFSFVWVTIKVDGKVCSSDEELTSAGLDGFSIHAAATCILPLSAGNHLVFVERKEAGVKDKDTRLFVRHVVLTE